METKNSFFIDDSVL